MSKAEQRRTRMLEHLTAIGRHDRSIGARASDAALWAQARVYGLARRGGRDRLGPDIEADLLATIRRAYAAGRDPMIDSSTDKRIEDALAAGTIAFWADVAATFPEITTGDMDPLRVVNTEQALRAAIVSWLDANQPLGRGWADAWPDTITLGDAADEIDFDLFQGDDPDLVLVKTSVRAAEHYAYSTAELAANDAEDRTSRLEDGLYGDARNVPPVVILPRDGLRDGHHRIAIAHEAGLTTVPAYTVPSAPPASAETSRPSTA